MTSKTAASTVLSVPLNKLALDPKNVRKTYSKDGIEELAATIRADSYRLLQNLVVRKAEKKGQYLVCAGGRRLAALQLLADQGEIAKDFSVDCREREANEALEVSLIENIAREDMHPVDQFEAYYAMAEEGKAVADIAARFGKTEAFIKGRLALARVSPVLLDLYRNEDMSFEQLSAFTLCDDHERQVDVWESLPYWDTGADRIRRSLQTDSVAANDKRLRFIGGIEVYEAAGGAVKRDLFDDEHAGYATDAALVEKLVTDKMESAAESLRIEGWNWIECCESGTGPVYGMERVYPEAIPLNEDQQTALDALEAELSAVMERFDCDEATEEDDANHDRLQAEIEALRDQGETYNAEDIARSGCVLYMDYRGALVIERGLIKASKTPEAETVQNMHETPASSEQPFKMPAAFVQELSAQKTAAIRIELAYNPTIALATVVHALLLNLYTYGGRDKTALEITLTSTRVESSIKDAEDAKAVQALATLTDEMKAVLPENPADLWDYCLQSDQKALLNLLAFAAAQSVNAIQQPHFARTNQCNHADQIASALQMDMREWFVPTAANYFSRISKAGIEAALSDAKGADFAHGISGMKKAEAAAYAERQIAGTGWLPMKIRLESDKEADLQDVDADEDQNDEDDYNGDLDADYSQAAE